MGGSGLESVLLTLLCVGGALAFVALWVFLVWRSGKRAAWARLRLQSPRCPRCGYDLKGLIAARCPECGASYTLEELWLAQRDLPEAIRRRAELEGRGRTN